MKNIPISLALLILLFSSIRGFSQKANEDTQEDEKTVYHPIEEYPEYPGGEAAMYKFLGKSVVYPTVAKDSCIDGKVYVRFTVDEVGKVTNAEVIRGVHKALDAEALRVIRAMPKWKPGKLRGEPVKVQFTLPVIFSLDCTKKERRKGKRRK